MEQIHHPVTGQTASVHPDAVSSWEARGWKEGPPLRARTSSRSTAEQPDIEPEATSEEN